MKRRREGFLLITVVVLLAIVTLMLARLAYWSMGEASNAVEYERRVRQEWAATSIERYFLENANRLLQRPPVTATRVASSADQSLARPASVAAAMAVGGFDWAIVLTDESRKVNLNAILGERPVADFDKLVESLVEGTSHWRLKDIPSRPTAEEGGSGRLENWFDLPSSATPRRMLCSASRPVTLWGDGRVNIYGADDRTVDGLWRYIFGRSAPDQLHSLRKLEPVLTWPDLAERLDLRESQRLAAQRWFTTESRSVSVSLHSPTDNRVPAMLFVQWSGTTGHVEKRGYVCD